mgnify:CR=1 FL=1
MRRRGRHVALRRPRNFADCHRRVTRHRAGVSLSLLWPPLLNEKTKKVHSPFSTSAHVFYVHMPKAFAEHCSINKWNEEIWENSHILNKRLIHVAVFPGGTAKYTPEQQALRAGFVVLNTKWSTDRHIKAAKKRHAKKPAEAARMKEGLASAVAQRKITDGCLRSGVAKVLTLGRGGHADVRPLRAGESGAADEAQDLGGEQEEARHASKVTRVMRCDNALRLIMRCVAAALVELREQEVICSPYTVARLRAPTPKLLHCATASIKIRHHCAPTAYRVLPRACFTTGCASSSLLVPLQAASKAGLVGRKTRRPDDVR